MQTTLHTPFSLLADNGPFADRCLMVLDSSCGDTETVCDDGGLAEAGKKEPQAAVAQVLCDHALDS